MKAARSNDNFGSGSTLIESVIALGVLAVAIPLVSGVLAEAGKCGMASHAESHSCWIIPACMDEIRASRAGRPQYFRPTTPGQTFPPAGEVWALAFAPDGKPVGKISHALYDRGIGMLDGETVGYIASMDGSAAPAKTGASPLLRVHLALEYPAASPAALRRKLDFHTRMP